MSLDQNQDRWGRVANKNKFLGTHYITTFQKNYWIKLQNQVCVALINYLNSNKFPLSFDLVFIIVFVL